MIKPAELGPALNKTRLFLILGEEDCLRDQAIETIRTHRASRSQDKNAGDGKSDAGDFSCDVLYGDDANAQEILARVQEVPFFSTHQVVLLKWADKLPARDGEALIPYFSAPSDSTTLIVSAGKLDGRLKWVQALKKQAVVVNCAPLYDNQRLGWVRQEAGRLGIRLDAEAVGLLKELAGEGLSVVRRELEKLALYVSTKGTVTAHDVVAVQGAEPGASVFDLSGAVIHGRVAQALLIVEKNLEAGEAPLRILGALLWQYRRLWKAKDGLNRRVSEAAVAKSLGITTFRQGEFFAIVKRVPLRHFPEAFHAFSVTDRALKGAAAASPHRIMHALIVDLCRLAKVPRPQFRKERAI
ncbi:MAG: DNA polymerase III subunit delta [Nitrospira sp. SB0677_bin_15]|nr:DNA polymerase III subunit delta [Nitrospira sp. SB0677_bin_15]